jgi:hypothetical protein
MRKNMKIYIPLLILIIGTLFFTSCSSDEEVATTTTAATASAAITGETMSIGSTDYTTSLMSNCMDADWTTDAGVVLYMKKQFWIYDNGSVINHANYYSDITCTTFVSSFVYDGSTFTSPMDSTSNNASIEYKSTTWVFNDATVKDYAGTTIDNSSYYVLLFDATCDGKTCQGFKLIYPKSTSVIEMTTQNATNESSLNTSDNKTLTEQYTSQ